MASENQTTGWQPIETAPYAVTVLLFIPATPSQDWDIVMKVATDEWRRKAAFWMPLPSPPGSGWYREAMVENQHER